MIWKQRSYVVASKRLSLCDNKNRFKHLACRWVLDFLGSKQIDKIKILPQSDPFLIPKSQLFRLKGQFLTATWTTGWVPSNAAWCRSLRSPTGGCPSSPGSSWAGFGWSAQEDSSLVSGNPVRFRRSGFRHLGEGPASCSRPLPWWKRGLKCQVESFFKTFFQNANPTVFWNYNRIFACLRSWCILYWECRKLCNHDMNGGRD